MISITQKLKRCMKCKKVIRESNKSGYCSSCLPGIRQAEKKRKKCGICKEQCSGKMLIEVVKGKYISLCESHYKKLKHIKNPKERRKQIKTLREYEKN